MLLQEILNRGARVRDISRRKTRGEKRNKWSGSVAEDLELERSRGDRGCLKEAGRHLQSEEQKEEEEVMRDERCEIKEKLKREGKALQ